MWADWPAPRAADPDSGAFPDPDGSSFAGSHRHTPAHANGRSLTGSGGDSLRHVDTANCHAAARTDAG